MARTFTFTGLTDPLSSIGFPSIEKQRLGFLLLGNRESIVRPLLGGVVPRSHQVEVTIQSASFLAHRADVRAWDAKQGTVGTAIVVQENDTQVLDNMLLKQVIHPPFVEGSNTLVSRLQLVFFRNI